MSTKYNKVFFRTILESAGLSVGYPYELCFPHAKAGYLFLAICLPDQDSNRCIVDNLLCLEATYSAMS